MSDTESISIAKEIQQETGPTFYLATRFLPNRVRYPTYVLYAFFRKADQIVDDPNPAPPAEQAAALETYQRIVLLDEETDDVVLSAMAELVEEHHLDEADITAFIEAMQADIDATDYDSFEELETYLRGSAVSVGYMMLQLMDPDATEARPHAKALGEAFQLTNFIRDVREDVTEFNRVYLPKHTLQRHGVTTEDVRSLEVSSGFQTAIKEELERTETRYRSGVAGIELLPNDCQFPVLLAAILYAEYHRMIADQDYNVIDDPPSFSKARYLILTARTWVAWKRSRDPETIFYQISPIDPKPDTSQQTNTTLKRHPSMISRLTSELRDLLPGTE